MSREAKFILVAGAVILAVSLGIRHAFGLFLQPMSEAQNWGREQFGFAMAVQNLVGGISQPFTGMLADRLGPGRAIFGGAVLYALGLVLMAAGATTSTLTLGGGVLVGLGLSGTSFAVVFGAVSRAVAPERRSMAMGISSAVGSFGQFVLLPGSLALINRGGWAQALLWLALLAVLMAPVALIVARNTTAVASEPDVTVRAALVEAFEHRGFWLLSFGFFVCGFQVVFIGIHLPAYLTDEGLSLGVATTTLALIGLFNIAGTYLAGCSGGFLRKPLLLTGIYLGRAGVIAAFLLLPLSAGSAYVFGIVLGLFWLSTVPLTNGTVAAVFGARNLSMLGGIVFFFHQTGAFLGGWLGGYVYDRTDSYDSVWLIAIGLSLAAAFLNYPIRETPVVRLDPARAV